MFALPSAAHPISGHTHVVLLQEFEVQKGAKDVLRLLLLQAAWGRFLLFKHFY